MLPETQLPGPDLQSISLPCPQHLQERRGFPVRRFLLIVVFGWPNLCCVLYAADPIISSSDIFRPESDVRTSDAKQSAAQSAVNGSTGDHPVRMYGGRSIDEWQELMKSLDFQSPAAEVVVPGLLTLVQDDQLPWFTRRQAALTLGRIGKPAQSAVPVLMSLLEERSPADEPSTAAWAAKALSLFGTVAAPATPSLVRLLNDDRAPHLDRLSCIEALGRIGGSHEEAIPALIRLAQNDAVERFEETELREAAVDGLALTGNAAAPAVPTLIRLTREDAVRLRKKAAVALGSIGTASGIAAPSLVELVLFDEFQEVREAAAASLATIGDIGELALQKLLSDQDGQVRRLSAHALGQLPRSNKRTEATLANHLDDPDAIVRITAAESLWKLTRAADAIIPTILEGLTSEDRQLRIRAYRLLIELGPAAHPAESELERLAKDGRPHIRQVAKKAIKELSETNTVISQPAP